MVGVSVSKFLENEGVSLRITLFHSHRAKLAWTDTVAVVGFLLETPDVLITSCLEKLSLLLYVQKVVLFGVLLEEDSLDHCCLTGLSFHPTSMTHRL